jgi:hypothetical protein
LATAAEIAYKAIAIVGGVLAAIGTAVGFFLSRTWQKHDRALDQRERSLAAQREENLKQRELLISALRWFEGGTQNRSIGIAVVNTNWELLKEFRALWIEVLANQAIYLLMASDQKTAAHEHENLRRIMQLLIRERQLLDRTTQPILCATIAGKHDGTITTGLTLTPELEARLKQWGEELGCRAKPGVNSPGHG